MELPLVVGVDGSQSSLPAVDRAAEGAGRRSCALRLVRASLWDRYERTTPGAPDGEDGGAERIRATAYDRAHTRRPELRIATSVRPEETPDALLHAAHNACTPVTGRCGRGPLRNLLLGSVSLTVAARAACPVTVVRVDPVALSDAHEQILFGMSESPSHGSVPRFAFGEAAVRGCALDAVRAWRSSPYEAAGEQTCPQRRQAGRSLRRSASPRPSTPRWWCAPTSSRVRRDTSRSTPRPPPICWSSAHGGGTVTSVRNWAGWGTRCCTLRGVRWPSSLDTAADRAPATVPRPEGAGS